MTRALPQQQTLPAIDPALVRAKLAELFEDYTGRVERAGTGDEVNQLVRDYAAACLAALEGDTGREAEELRAYYRGVVAQVEGEIHAKRLRRETAV
jgi:hypothetical protein